ncbi:MAG: SHD1 domain-containing protein [Verrucomicrobiales bacterium]
MKPPYPFSLRRLLSLGLSFALASPLFARQWTDVSGKTIEAEYVSHSEFEVKLRMANGKVYDVQLSRLSQGDVEFVRSGEAGKMASAGGTDANAEDEGTGTDEASLNWDDPWPAAVKYEGDGGIEVVSENADTKEFIYTSENYRFTADARLSKSVVSSFADLFEATRLYCRTLPLAIDGGRKNDGKYDIFLFENKDDYVKAGGPPSSAGVFIGGKNIVMVPFQSLGLQKVGSGYMRDRDKSNKTLPHELAHQLTPPVYYRAGSRGWFTEGIAEYVGITPYRNGRFNVRSNINDIKEYVCGYGEDGRGGRAIGEEITAPHLADFMLMSYAQFTDGYAGGSTQFNYGFGALLTTYFCHFDGEGDAARLKSFLKALREKPRDTDPEEFLKILLDGRSYEELQEEIYRAWRSKGVKIEFKERKKGEES